MTDPNKLSIPRDHMLAIIPHVCHPKEKEDKDLTFLKAFAAAREQTYPKNDNVTIEQLFNRAIPIFNEPDRDYCRLDIATMPETSQLIITTSDYELKKGFWSLLQLNPFGNSDTAALCSSLNIHMDTVHQTAPKEIESIVTSQAKKADNQGWSYDKEKFREKLNLCTGTLANKRNAYINYENVDYDVQEFCLETMKMVVPTSQQSADNPVAKLQKRFDNEWLWAIPFSSWNKYDTFCEDVVDKWSHKVAAFIGDFLAIGLMLTRVSGRFLIVLLFQKTIAKLLTKTAQLAQAAATKLFGGKKPPEDKSPKEPPVPPPPWLSFLPL